MQSCSCVKPVSKPPINASFATNICCTSNLSLRVQNSKFKGSRGNLQTGCWRAFGVRGQSEERAPTPPWEGILRKDECAPAAIPSEGCLSDPPTQGELQAVADKHDEIIIALRRQVVLTLRVRDHYAERDGCPPRVRAGLASLRSG